jgi:hypothetical protein
MSKAKLTCRVCNAELVPGKNWHTTRICRSCAIDEINRRGRERYAKHKHQEQYTPPRDCSVFLGCYVAERVLKHVFNNVKLMPRNNRKFDFICNRGKKIDVKSSCLRKGDYPRWAFTIGRNKVADYFLCLAFDDREHLNPVHLWLIPGDDVNDRSTIQIKPRDVSKWNKFELDIHSVITCCNTMKKLTL